MFPILITATHISFETEFYRRYYCMTGDFSKASLICKSAVTVEEKDLDISPCSSHSRTMLVTNRDD